MEVHKALNAQEIFDIFGVELVVGSFGFYFDDYAVSTYDSRGNELSYSDTDYWEKSTYDSSANKIGYCNSEGRNIT